MSFRRQSWFNRYKVPIIVGTGAIFTGIISFIITVNIYNENDENLNDKVLTKLPDEDNMIIVNLEDENNNSINSYEIEEVSEDGVSTTEEYLGDNIIDVIEISEDEYSEFVGKIAGNTHVKTDENVIETVANVEKNKEESNKKEENKKTFEWIMPVEGSIGLNYAMDKLIYSNTLEEWITHNGIDIIANKDELVKAIESGTVESVKMDPRYGNTIIINHGDEYKSIYSNLNTTELVYVGKKVEKGEIISGVGVGFGFESKEKPHMHLTILKNGEIINPEQIINMQK